MNELIQYRLKINDLLELIKEKLEQIKDSNSQNNKEVIEELFVLINFELNTSTLKKNKGTNFENTEFLKKLRAKHNKLTYGQEMICHYVYLGLSYKEISKMMNISPKTAENRIYNISKSIKTNEFKTLRQYLISI